MRSEPGVDGTPRLCPSRRGRPAGRPPRQPASAASVAPLPETTFHHTQRQEQLLLTASGGDSGALGRAVWLGQREGGAGLAGAAGTGASVSPAQAGPRAGRPPDLSPPRPPPEDTPRAASQVSS